MKVLLLLFYLGAKRVKGHHSAEKLNLYLSRSSCLMSHLLFVCMLHGQGWWLGRLYLYDIAEMTVDIAGKCCHLPGAICLYSLSDPFTERVIVVL